MTIRTSHRRYASLAGLLLGIGAAHAQTTAPEKPLEEVIVSGGLLQRSTLDTVASISIVPAEQLQAQNIRDLYDLLLRQPNLNAAKEDKFSVRGISNEGVGPGGTGRPTVSIFIDGVRQSGRGVANTWDVRQVEFYRGPQSTAFGPGSLAGAVVIQTHEPNYESFDGELKLGGGNYGGREAGIAFGAPLGAGFAFRYAGETNQTDGEVTNITLDDDEWQARKRYMQRLKLGWTNDSWYSATLTGQVSKLREGIEYLPPERAAWSSNSAAIWVQGFRCLAGLAMSIPSSWSTRMTAWISPATNFPMRRAIPATWELSITTNRAGMPALPGHAPAKVTPTGRTPKACRPTPAICSAHALAMRPNPSVWNSTGRI